MLRKIDLYSTASRERRGEALSDGAAATADHFTSAFGLMITEPALM
jgi:hypothetical protein